MQKVAQMDVKEMLWHIPCHSSGDGDQRDVAAEDGEGRGG